MFLPIGPKLFLLIVALVALVLFGVDAWRSKSLVSGGLFCLTLAAIVTG